MANRNYLKKGRYILRGEGGGEEFFHKDFSIDPKGYNGECIMDK